jgi:hypothetical protein
MANETELSQYSTASNPEALDLSFKGSVDELFTDRRSQPHVCRGGLNPVQLIPRVPPTPVEIAGPENCDSSLI